MATESRDNEIAELKRLNESLLRKLTGVREKRKHENQKYKKNLDDLRKWHKQELSWYSSKRLVAERNFYRSRYFYVIDYYKDKGIISDKDLTNFENQFYEVYDIVMKPIEMEENADSSF